MQSKAYQPGQKSGTMSGVKGAVPRPIKQSKPTQKEVGPCKPQKTSKMTLA